MPLRVIAGIAKGRRLKLVPGDTTRPIMDRAKEALFSILGRDVQNTAWLDLFAGTGSVGIEALSRGAAHVTFVDMERKAVETIRDNLELTRLNENATVRRADAFAILKNPPDQHYETIYIAPPQYKRLWVMALEALEANPAWLPEGTQVIVQIDPSEREPVALTRLQLEDERRYGKTVLLFYVAEEPDQVSAED